MPKIYFSRIDYSPNKKSFINVFARNSMDKKEVILHPMPSAGYFLKLKLIEGELQHSTVMKFAFFIYLSSMFFNLRKSFVHKKITVF